MRKNFHEVLLARQIMIQPVASIEAGSTLGQFESNSKNDGSVPYYILKKNGRVAGVVSNSLLGGHLNHFDPDMLLDEIAIKNYEVVSNDATFEEIFDKIRANHTALILVMDFTEEPSGGKVIGVITKNELASSVSVTEGLFSDHP